MEKLDKNLVLLVAAVVLLVSNMFQVHEATRILDDEEETLMMAKKDLVLQSLKGDVPSSGSNGCTYVSGQGGAPCTTQRVYAGHAPTGGHGHAYPDLVIPTGVATDANNRIQ